MRDQKKGSTLLADGGSREMDVNITILRILFRFLHTPFLLVLTASPAFTQSPYLFTPSGRDDAAALRAALITHRWVQLNGTYIRIDTPIDLETDDGVPLH